MTGSAPTHTGSGQPGGVIVLHARLSPLATRLMPAWAAVCGAIASPHHSWEPAAWAQLLLAVLLVDAGWGTLWAGIGGTNWAAPMRRWKEWPIGGKIAILPFAQVGSRGDRLSRWLGQLRAWWRQDLWPACGRAIVSITAGLVLTALLTAVLGQRALLLGIAALATMELGAVWSRGSGCTPPVFDAIVVVMLPWLAGYSVFAEPTPTAALLPALVALCHASARWSDRGWGHALLFASSAGLGAFLLTAGQPVTGAAVCGLVLPQLLLVPWLRRGMLASGFVRFARPWLMLTMIAAALAV